MSADEAYTRVLTFTIRRARRRDIIEAADIYRLYFHGPAYQVLERAWWDGKRMSG